MKAKRAPRAAAKRKKGQPVGRAMVVGMVIVLTLGLGAGAMLWRHGKKSTAEARYVPRPAGQLTFNKDVAPIIFAECSGCHRPGQSSPFDLLTFQDVKAHAEDIVKVTERRYMPPWLPEHGTVNFADARHLTVDQIGVLRQWVREGAAEGAMEDKPPLPQWVDGWQFGTPDLVVEMPEAYTLPAAGRDVYRNFVIPIPLSQRRFVRAIEFRPNTKVLHHVLMFFDRTRESRRQDTQDAEVGFGGMSPPMTVESPGGAFLSWQPGRGPTRSPEGLAWPLPPGSDLILQAHMQPSGRPEKVQPSIAFYFTDTAPTNTPFKMVLSSYAIDIPANKSDYEIQDSYVLPVDVDLLAALPHAHYLGKELECEAVLPDGRKQWLLKINHWDFNWQSDYRYAQPIHLPKGTRLHMRFVYDNSAENVRNPNRPPARVKYGVNSTDEMGELWLQMLPRNAADLQVLQADYEKKLVQEIIAYNLLMLERNPSNAHAHVQLGKALLGTRPLPEALAHFHRAIELNPNEEEAHYNLGVIAMDTDLVRAEMAFKTTIRVNPENFRARSNLGLVLTRSRRFTEAGQQLQAALRLNPGDPVVLANLEFLARARSGRR